MNNNNLIIKQDHMSKPFNPLIANMFYKAGFVESFTSVSSRTLERWIKQLKDEDKIMYEGVRKPEVIE